MCIDELRNYLLRPIQLDAPRTGQGLSKLLTTGWVTAEQPPTLVSSRQSNLGFLKMWDPQVTMGFLVIK